MRIEILSIAVVLLFATLQVTEGAPGHNVHDYYKCNSDYARRNYRHCAEDDLDESRNFGRVGRNIDHYNTASNIHLSTLTVMASVVLGLYQTLRF